MNFLSQRGRLIRLPCCSCVLRNTQVSATHLDRRNAAANQPCDVGVRPGAQELFFFPRPFPPPGCRVQNPFSLTLELNATHSAPRSSGHCLVQHSPQQPFFGWRPPVIKRFAFSEPFAANGKERSPHPVRQLLVRHCSQQPFFLQRPFPPVPDKMRDAQFSAPIADSRYMALEQLRNLFVGSGT